MLHKYTTPLGKKLIAWYTLYILILIVVTVIIGDGFLTIFGMIAIVLPELPLVVFLQWVLPTFLEVFGIYGDAGYNAAILYPVYFFVIFNYLALYFYGYWKTNKKKLK